MTTPRKQFLDRIRELEGIVDSQGNTIVNQERTIAELEETIGEMGSETQGLARASMQIREEDVEQLVEYKEMNTKLIKFVEKVAESKSKFGREARKLLGI